MRKGYTVAQWPLSGIAQVRGCLREARATHWQVEPDAHRLVRGIAAAFAIEAGAGGLIAAVVFLLRLA
jgi:hypothetical protein